MRQRASTPNDRENACRQTEAATAFSCVPGPCEAALTRAASVPIEPHRGPVVGLHLRGGCSMTPPTSHRFVVTFNDWTVYRLEVNAETAEQAIEIAQSKST